MEEDKSPSSSGDVADTFQHSRQPVDELTPNREYDDSKHDQLDQEKARLTFSHVIMMEKPVETPKQQRREPKVTGLFHKQASMRRQSKNYADQLCIPKQERQSKQYGGSIELQKISVRQRICLLIKSKTLDVVIITLVLMYTCIIFAYFALDTREYEGVDAVTVALQVIQFIELAILVTFCLEILLRVYVYTAKVNEIQVQQQLYQLGKSVIKTPVERIIDIMNNLNTNIEDSDLSLQLKWCIEIVNSNKLYEPILGEGEAAVWGNIYASNQQTEKRKQQLTVTSVASGSNSPSKTKKGMLNGVAGNHQIDTVIMNSFTFKNIIVPIEHVEFFKQTNQISFDIFKYHETIKEGHLPYFLVYNFTKFDIFNKVMIEPHHLFNWTTLVSKGYEDDNYYHNKMHAFDVTQTVHYFIQTQNFILIGDLSPLEIGIMYMAAAAHDYEHPGFNNPFLVNSRHELAITYNDKSPLENHHAYSVFKLFEENQCNVFTHLSKGDLKKSRERIISMIIHTDNSSHFADLAKLKGRLTSLDFDAKEKDKDICMGALLHAADVSNPFKPWDICKVWTKKVLDEFWNQGDIERENHMPISYLCDRFTTNTSKSQAGFIDFIVKPLYETMGKFLPTLDQSTFETNKANWAQLVDFYDQELEKIKNISDQLAIEALKIEENNQTESNGVSVNKPLNRTR